jgi:hypothetical protein
MMNSGLDLSEKFTYNQHEMENLNDNVFVSSLFFVSARRMKGNSFVNMPYGTTNIHQPAVKTPSISIRVIRFKAVLFLELSAEPTKKRRVSIGDT